MINLPQAMTRFFLTLVGLLCISATYFAQAADDPQPIYGSDNGKAIEGYDVVNYFTEGKPAKGDARYQADYAGTQWQFKSEANLQLFKAEPSKYVPQFGGFCAYAASKDSIADGDPDNWRVVDGKLYLNTNFIAHQLWKSDIPANVKAAEGYWPDLKPRIEKELVEKRGKKSKPTN